MAQRSYQDWADMPDAALLTLYVGGAPEAAVQLAGRHVPKLLSLGMRMLGDRAEAEDIAQEAMLRLWRQAPMWQADGAAVGTWLYRVASNLCIDRLRKRARLRTPLDAVPDPVDEARDPLGRMQDEARSAALQSALADLPVRQRQAVVLRHIEGLTNPEIAEIMDTGVEAIESLIARGKRALGQSLSARREELGYIDD